MGNNILIVMEKERYFTLIKEMKSLNITPQDLEKYWDEFDEVEKGKKQFINSELIKIKDDAISRFLEKIISTGKSSYLLVKDVDVHLHYSGVGYLVDFIGPKIDINILEENTISIHTWNSIYYKPEKCGGKYSLFFDSSDINWDSIIIVEQDVFDSVIEQLQDKTSLFIDSLKDYFYEVKV